MQMFQQRFFPSIVIMVLAQAALADPPPGWKPDFDAPRHPERLLVRFKTAASEQGRQQAHAAVQAQEIKSL